MEASSKMAAMKHGCVIAAMVCLSGCGATQQVVTTPQDANWAKVNAEARARAQPAPEPTLLPVTHFSAGRLFERRGQLREAAEQYRKAVALNQDFIQAYNRLGAVLTRMGQWDQADQVFVSAIQRAPDAAYLRNNLAFSYMAQGRWQDAEVELRNALQLKPSFMRARVNLAVVLAKQDDAESAFAQFSQAMPLAEAYFNMGVLHRSDRRFEQAQDAFASAVALRPNWAKARTQLQQTDALMAASQAEVEATTEAAALDPQGDSVETPAPDPVATAEPAAPDMEAAVAVEPVAEVPAREPVEETEPEPVATAEETESVAPDALPVAEPVEQTSARPATCEQAPEPVRSSPAPKVLIIACPAGQQETPQVTWFQDAEASVWTQDVSAAPKAEPAKAAPADQQPAPAATEQTTDQLPEARPVEMPDEVSVNQDVQETCVVQRRPVCEPFARWAHQVVEYSGWPGVLRKAGRIDVSWLASQRWLGTDVVLSPLDAGSGKLVWERSVPANG